MPSIRHANFNRAVVLSLLMMMMTQVGYLESMNPWTNGEETLDQSTDVLETGGAGASNFTASVEGAELIIDEAMTDITFQYYNASAASGSGSGSGGGSGSGTSYGNGTIWQVADINSGTTHSNPGDYMEILVGDTLYFSAHDGSSGYELWAHDTSNASTWRVADINSGSWPAVTPDITWRYSSVIRSTSVRMMEAAATNCGLMIPQTPQLGE